jgi:ABC-type transport system involved in multi-copper enzyme maturation permease subunit
MSNSIQTPSIDERILPGSSHHLEVFQATARKQAMQAVILMVAYILTAAVVQGIGFLISRVVEYQFPAAGLTTFLVLFLGAFWIAWPIAVRITSFEKPDARSV